MPWDGMISTIISQFSSYLYFNSLSMASGDKSNDKVIDFGRDAFGNDTNDLFVESKFDEPTFVEDNFTSEDSYGVDGATGSKESARDLSELDYTGSDSLDPAVKKPGLNPEQRKQIAALMSNCGLSAVGGGITGLVLGSSVGTVSSLVYGIVGGLHKQPGFARHVISGGMKTGGQFAIWLGTFNGIKCEMISIRGGKRDPFNSFGGRLSV